MKKIFAISLIAMTAVTSARADIASQAYVDQHDTTTLNSAKSYTDDKIGTYTGAAAGSETVAAAIAAAVSGGTANAVTRSGSDAVGIDDSKPVFVNASGVVTPFTTALGTAAFTASTAYDAAGTAAGVQTALETTIGTLPSGQSSVVGYIDSIKTTADGAVQSVAEGSTNGTIDVDGTDVAVHGLGTAAYTASTAYDAAGTAAGVQTALETTIGTLPSGQSSVVGYIDSIKTTADGAVQSVAEGSTNGTIDVDGTDVAVHGLDALAYKATIANADVASGAAIDISKIAMPTTTGSDGTYVLTGTISGNTITYKWENITRGTAQQGGGE